MQTVRDLLRAKGNAVYSVSPDATVFEALQVMADKDIGALLVVDGGRPVGIMSERDYARKVALKGKTAQETRIREIMTEKVIYMRPEQTVNECMSVMTNRRIRHLPVMEDDRLTGMISIGDVVKAIISEQEFMITQLENYITGVR
jgi:CBS domain-containing protein